MINVESTRTAFLAIVGVALFFFTYAFASAPTRPASRLGMRGLKRRRAIENNPTYARIEPVVRWLGVRISGMISPETAKNLDTQIGLAGDFLGLTPEEYISLSMVTAVGGALFGALIGVLMGNLGMAIMICLALGGALPYLQISGEAQRRLKEVTRGLPYVIDLMALAMSAGLDFPGAVRQVVQKSSNPDDPLIEEMTRILQELQLGRTRRQALLDFGQRAPTPSVTEFVSALIQAEERGNPVAEVLQIQAGVSRMRRTVRAEESAAKASVKMVGPLFLLFACIMLLVMGPMILSLASQSF
jgi:tight adherence protein C